MALSKRDYNYLYLAEEVAKTSSFPRFKLGALIVTTKGVVTSVNTLKTHPLQERYRTKLVGPSGQPLRGVHAEIAAIAKCISRYGAEALEGASIYVARWKQSGCTGLAKPCADCTQAIKDFKIKKVIYTE